MGARFEQIETLCRNGAAIVALRAALNQVPITKDVFGTSSVSPSMEFLDSLLATLRLTLDALREQQGRWRALPSLLPELEKLPALGHRFSQLAGELNDLLMAGWPAHTALVGAPPSHFIALLELVDHGVGLAVPWNYYSRSSGGDGAITRMDPRGEQQVDRATKILIGLASGPEVRHFEAFCNHRAVVPMVAIDSVGLIEGRSMGLPTLLAMLSARFDLAPAVGTGATGAIDVETLPRSPGKAFWTKATHERFMDVPIEKVRAIPCKVRAAIEQHPSMQRILVPSRNRREITDDADLLQDLAAYGTDIIYIDRVADIFASGPLFSRPLYAPPLRLDADFTSHEMESLAFMYKALTATGAIAALFFLALILSEFWG